MRISLWPSGDSDNTNAGQVFLTYYKGEITIQMQYPDRELTFTAPELLRAVTALIGWGDA